MTMPQPYLTGAAAVAAVAGVGVGTRRLEEGGGRISCWVVLRTFVPPAHSSLLTTCKGLRLQKEGSVCERVCVNVCVCVCVK
jgi:hypothetical protein